MAMAEPAATRPRRTTKGVLQAALIGAILTVAGIGLVMSLNMADTKTPPRFTDQAVEAVFPGEDELDLRQARLGIDMRPGYTAVLVVDGREIPEDQHERVPELGQVFYTAGPGKETGALEPGRHCVNALMWQPARESRHDGRRYSWCFNVH